MIAFKIAKGEKSMKKKKLLALLLAFTCATATLAGCGAGNGTKETAKTEATTKNAEEIKSNDKVSDHEVIRMQAPFRTMGDFIDVVHEKYPEINLEAVPYSGANYTSYVKAQLKAGDLPDIYCTTTYAPGSEDFSGKLLDLSGYDFTDSSQEASLREVTTDGAIPVLVLLIIKHC